MKQRKKQSIAALAGAIAEAEAKKYETEGTDLNGLGALLKDFLEKDHSPDREQLKRDYIAGTFPPVSRKSTRKHCSKSGF